MQGGDPTVNEYHNLYNPFIALQYHRTKRQSLLCRIAAITQVMQLLGQLIYITTANTNSWQRVELSSMLNNNSVESEAKPPTLAKSPITCEGVMTEEL